MSRAKPGGHHRIAHIGVSRSGRQAEAARDERRDRRPAGECWWAWWTARSTCSSWRRSIRGAREVARWRRAQREYYLNEQMKAIQKELGDLGRRARARLEELERARSPKTKHARRKPVEKAKGELNEFSKLKQMSPMSAEADGGAQLPRVAAGRAVEEEDSKIKQGPARGRSRPCWTTTTIGLDKVKDRILEYLAVQSAR